MRYPMYPLDDMNPTPENDPQVLIGNGMYRRAVNLHSNRHGNSLDKLAQAIAFPPKITGIGIDALLNVSGWSLLLSLLEFCVSLGAVAIAWGILSAVLVTYVSVLFTVAAFRKSSRPAVAWRIALLILACVIAGALDGEVTTTNKSTVSRPLERAEVRNSSVHLPGTEFRGTASSAVPGQPRRASAK